MAYPSHLVGMHRALALLALLLVAGCSGPPSNSLDDTGNDAPSAGDGAGDGGMPADGSTVAPPVRTEAVQDSVSFSGTLGASACWFDGTDVSCANVGGSNVLVYMHDRKGEFAGGELKVSFTPAPASGPHTRAYIAEGCEDSCRLVAELADNGPSLQSPPLGTSGTYDLHLPSATILDNQTLVVRVTPILLTTVASASPTYDIDLAGTLDFVVPV